MRAQRIGGYTLIEILIVLVVVCILLQSAIGGLQTLLDKSRNTTALQTAITALDRARSLAVIRSKYTGVCVLASGGSCNADWDGNELAVFIDANQNWQRDDDEEIIYRQPWPNKSIRLKWGSNWRDKAIISYEPNGNITSNGTLTLQKPTGEKIAALVINKPGRARIDTRPQ